MTRGIRNCNPGNIRRSKERFRGEVTPSQDALFKQFRGMEWGYRAMFVILNTYRTRYALTTLEALVGRWAPPSENDTRAYIAAVKRATGRSRHSVTDTLDHDTMVAVVAAMSRVENGVEAVKEQVEEGWRLFAAGRR